MKCMKLKNILVGLEGLKAKGELDKEIKGIESNSANIKKGFVFVAIKGYSVDGHDFIQEAIEKGATTVVVEGGHSNSIGTAGFIIALLGLVFCWIPFIDFVLWFLGLVFSIIGLFKAPRGMAIAGLVLSLVLIIVIIMIFGTIMELFDSILK